MLLSHVSSQAHFSSDCKASEWSVAVTTYLQSCFRALSPVSGQLLFLKFIYPFIYLFLAALGLRCCARAFSSCGERGLLFIAVRGLLIAVASLVTEHGL